MGGEAATKSGAYAKAAGALSDKGKVLLLEYRGNLNNLNDYKKWCRKEVQRHCGCKRQLKFDNAEAKIRLEQTKQMLGKQIREVAFAS